MNAATSSLENNTVLAKRAFVQQNCSSSLPIIWNSNTGLPETRAALHAEMKSGCQLTRPAWTFGFCNTCAAGAVLDWAAITAFVGDSIASFVMASGGTCPKSG